MVEADCMARTLAESEVHRVRFRRRGVAVAEAAVGAVAVVAAKVPLVLVAGVRGEGRSAAGRAA